MDIRPLITAEEIETKLADLGKQISEDYKGKKSCWWVSSAAPSW